jgi:hypothetical protein
MVRPAAALAWRSCAAAIRAERTLGLQSVAREIEPAALARPVPARRPFQVASAPAMEPSRLRRGSGPDWLSYQTTAASPAQLRLVSTIAGTSPLPQAAEVKPYAASAAALETSRLEPGVSQEWLRHKTAVASPAPLHLAGPRLVPAVLASVKQAAGDMPHAASAAPAMEAGLTLGLPGLGLEIDTTPVQRSIPAASALPAVSNPAMETSRPGSNQDWLAQAAAPGPAPLRLASPRPIVAGPALLPRATEVTSYVEPTAVLEMAHALEIVAPRFELDAIADAAAPAAEEPSDVVAACEQWMPSPAADVVTRMVSLSEAGMVAPTLVLRAPRFEGFAISGPFIAAAAWPAQPAAAMAVEMNVFPSDAAMPILAQPVLLPGTVPIFALALDGASHVAGPEPAPVESMPAMQVVVPAPCSIEPITAIRESTLPEASCSYGHAPASHAPVPAESFLFPTFRAAMMATMEVALPSLALPVAEQDLAPRLNCGLAAKAFPAPQSQTSESRPPVLELIRTLALAPPEAPAAAPDFTLPEPGFLEIEYFSHRPAAVISRNLQWQEPSVELIAPRFAIRPIFEKPEDAARQKKASKKPAMAEIFQLPEAKRKAANPAVHYAIKAIAASVVVGGVLWFAAGAMRIGNQTPAVNRDVSMIDSGSASDAGQPVTPSAGTRVASNAVPGSQPHGPIARVRQAIANRASATVTDSFRNGMEAWGTGPKAWAPGWSRHPEGYVQPGQLALFKPSLQYTDYHLEFFGQIDNRSMGWTVRSKDPKNYYAMKFSVVEPGLRPIIAMVHYSVVGGRKSRSVSTPLNVMVHNSKPFQVAVEVKGNRMVTSIDGQEVDTWIDDAIPAGGVGFFADAGEKSRLYWMKVSKNEDFLGRVCAYLSSRLGDGLNTSTELWPPEMPGRAPMPGQPRRLPSGPADATLAATAVGFGGARRRQRTAIWKVRSEIWSL